MNDGNKAGAKQQIVEKLRDSSNILVTVNTNPTVDELSAALGLTLLLNKLNKHATCVFSGDIPPAISFLDPEKTFEGTVDSLRDFIIALDKEKADHLRYKVDGDVVKIFITPYRTTINDEDLDFSQGDYNVELVLAVGVKNQDSLDKALDAHGRIFHDATVATISAGEDSSTLGSIDWSDPRASSYGEMMVGFADAVKNGKDLLDEQISTAFLTGIVAATDRFSNSMTSSRVMAVAAELMSAGANQQLIARKLEEAEEISNDKDSDSDGRKNDDGSMSLSEGKASKVKKDKQGKSDSNDKDDKPTKKKKDGDGELTISHEKKGDLDEVARLTEKENQSKAAEAAEAKLMQQAGAIAAEEKSDDEKLAEELEKVTGDTSNSAIPSVSELQNDIAAATSDIEKAASGPEEPQVEEKLTTLPPPINPAPAQDANNEPNFGGTLNATTEQAAEEKRRQEKDERNKTILSHEGSNYVGNDSKATYTSPLNSTMDPTTQEQNKPLGDPMAQTSAPTAPAGMIQPPAAVTLAQLDKENREPHEEARSAIDAAFAAQEELAPAQQSQQQEQPSPEPQAPVMPVAPPPLPPLPDFSTLPPLPGAPAPELTSQPSQVGPAPAEQQQAPNAQSSAPNPFVQPSSIQPPAPVAADPGQFQIPGQS